MIVESFEKIDKKTYAGGRYAKIRGVLRKAWVSAGHWSRSIDDMQAHGHMHEVLFVMSCGQPFVMTDNLAGRIRYFQCYPWLMKPTMGELSDELRRTWLNDVRGNMQRARDAGLVSLEDARRVLEEVYGEEEWAGNTSTH